MDLGAKSAFAPLVGEMDFLWCEQSHNFIGKVIAGSTDVLLLLVCHWRPNYCGRYVEVGRTKIWLIGGAFDRMALALSVHCCLFLNCTKNGNQLCLI